MFDVFYSEKKPGLFPHERQADSIEHAQSLSRTRYFWWVSYLADLSDWDFLWEPVPWQAHQRHAWCSQWQPDAGIYLVPRAGYTDTNYHTDRAITRIADLGKWKIPSNIDLNHFDFSWHPNPADPVYTYQFGTQHQRTGGPIYPMAGATDIKFVDQIRATTNRVATAVYEIDHLCGSAGQIPNATKTVRYFDNYRDTLIRIAKGIGNKHEFVWICSSICDYTDFDFSWHPEQWQATMLHVFASNDQKFGDTFFMHVPTFAARAEQHELLEWSDVNFVKTSVPRRPMPVVVHDGDSQVTAVKNTDWAGPLATFTNYDYVPGDLVTVPLWREQTKAIVPISDGAGTVVVPRVAVSYIRTQLYDYPHIDRSQRCLKDPPLDIVFISNGEPNAADNWFRLINEMGNRPNRVVQASNVNGRVAAYHAAARAAQTPWFFAVFAKLAVDDRFDWSWQPDRMQQPKHYIFHARNPVNGLCYGHQAMIAYNRQLVLDNPGVGLDFTLDSAHEVVPVVSGTAHYNTSPWMAWRTAFREVLKLRASLPDVENEYRINRWCANGEGDNAQWSSAGAQDALEYYDEVNGDFDALRKSYEWAWLATYAFVKRSLTPNQ